MRGLTRAHAPCPQDQYDIGGSFRWFRFSSCTSDGSVINDNEMFLSKTGNDRTLFAIDCKSGVDIGHLSQCVLPPLPSLAF